MPRIFLSGLIILMLIGSGFGDLLIAEVTLASDS
jgi:hypothetical protein